MANAQAQGVVNSAAPLASVLNGMSGAASSSSQAQAQNQPSSNMNAVLDLGNAPAHPQSTLGVQLGGLQQQMQQLMNNLPHNQTATPGSGKEPEPVQNPNNNSAGDEAEYYGGNGASTGATDVMSGGGGGGQHDRQNDNQSQATGSV